MKSHPCSKETPPWHGEQAHLIGIKDAPSILAELPEKLLLLSGNFSNADADVTFPGAHRRMENYFTGQNRNCNGKSHCSRQSFHSVYPFQPIRAQNEI